MNVLIVLLTIIFFTSVGYAIIRGFHFLPAKDTLIAIGTSYGLGVGLTAMQLYLYSRFAIPWQKEYLLIPWGILFVFVLVKNRKKIHLRFPAIPSLRLVDKLLLLGILLSVGYVIFEALLRPVVAWDAWANWLLQAKVYFMEGGVTPQLVAYTNSEYPLTINMLGAFVYVMLGKVDDTAVLLTSSAFYVFLALTFFAVLRRKFGMSYALLFTFLLVTTQNFVRHGGRLEAGLADLPLGYFAFVSVVLLFEYFKKSSVKLLMLFTVFLSITSLIKFEGLPLTLFIGICALVHIVRHRLYRHVFILFSWIIPFVVWKVDRRVMGLNDSYFSSSHGIEITIQKSINAFSGTLKELLNIKSWNMLWITYFYSLFAFGIKRDKALVVLNAIILSQFLLYLFIYNVTAWNNPESSIERLLLHIAPLVFYSIAVIGYTKLKK